MRSSTSSLTRVLTAVLRRGRGGVGALLLLTATTPFAWAQPRSTGEESGAASVTQQQAVITTQPCFGTGRRIVTTPKGTITTKYSPGPPSDTTFDATHSTWRPGLDIYPIGVDTSSSRICWFGGAVFGAILANMTWEDAHAYNQPCIRIVAKEWMKVDGIRCDNTDDGFRPRETSTGAQNVTMTVRNTYFTRIHDDCLENDGIIGGLLQNNLWSGCNTGVSEQPGGGNFSQPAGERLVLDHMLIGLWRTPHVGGAGENSLFKWSSSANDLVIKCSIFKVDDISLNHATAMAVPATIDDSACPAQPTTIVWLGGGQYPGDLPNGVRVSSQIGVWTRAVSAWKCAHGYQTIGC